MLIDKLISMTMDSEKDIFNYANLHGIDPLMLRSQLLLYLPKPSSEPSYEMEAVANEILEVHAHFDLTPYSIPVSAPLRSLQFRMVDASVAELVHRCFHYVGTYRPGLHFGLYAGDYLVCLGSVADFDLISVKDCIPWIPPTSIKVYSRFYAFPWAPENCFSYFFGLLKKHMVENHGTELMFTWSNPNIGFSGSSHIGAGWKMFAYEDGTCYLYEDGYYKTMRYFVKTHGTNNVRKLQHALGPRFEYARELHPLKLMAVPLQPHIRQIIPKVPYHLTRPIL